MAAGSAGVLFVSAVVMAFLYSFVNIQPGSPLNELKAWPKNVSRNMNIYLRPNQKTSIHEPKYICTNPKAKKNSDLILFVVNSATSHFDFRDRLRRSWISLFGRNERLRKQLRNESSADEENEEEKEEVKNIKKHKKGHRHSKRKDNEFEVVFVLGMHNDQNDTSTQKLIDEEAQTYGDILQESFIDTYYNLTLKTAMMLKWITLRCGYTVRYFVKTDDDVYVDGRMIFMQAKSIAMQFDKRKGTKKEYELRGRVSCNSSPARDPKGKWYCPKYIFSGKVYPCFVFGAGYLFSAPTAHALYKAALVTPFFHLEDVYITGFCRENAHPKIKIKDDTLISRCTKEHSAIFGQFLKPELKRAERKGSSSNQSLSENSSLTLEDSRKKESYNGSEYSNTNKSSVYNKTLKLEDSKNKTKLLEDDLALPSQNFKKMSLK